jgi:hypothetical protein
MTVVTERVASAVKDPRDLVSPELFDTIVGRVLEELPVAPSYAQRVVDQTLVFLKAVADNPTNKMLTPSKAVDPGWHAFLMFTQEYAAFCQDLTGGGFIHHAPVVNEDIRSGDALTRTLEVLHSTGYRVDEEMWGGWTSCGSGCGFVVQAG